MEEALTPMQRAHRRFVSGRPPITPQNTPLGAVALATAQRKRLAEILVKEKGLKDPRITSMAVVIRLVPPLGERLADTILVDEGQESKAIAFLEQYRGRFDYVIAGLLFAVLDGGEKRFLPYPIDRTPEGEAAIVWGLERQLQRKPLKEVN